MLGTASWMSRVHTVCDDNLGAVEQLVELLSRLDSDSRRHGGRQAVSEQSRSCYLGEVGEKVTEYLAKISSPEDYNRGVTVAGLKLPLHARFPVKLITQRRRFQLTSYPATLQRT